MKKSVKPVNMAGNKPLYIVDASVILKWFLNEPEYQLQALALREDFFKKQVGLGMPHYAYAEIINILARKFDSELILRTHSLLLTYGMPQHTISLGMVSLAVDLMKKNPHISFYDAGYHALALERGGTFLTADEKYYKKTRKAGHIMLLKDYGKKR